MSGAARAVRGNLRNEETLRQAQIRGSGTGRALALEIIAAARHRGYQRMRLDTVAGTMARALALYRELGFVEIPPYTENPVAGALCMELNIAS